MFETLEIRISFVDAIVEWIRVSYEMNDLDQLQHIRNSLTELPDEKLIEAWKEVEAFEKESATTLARIDRQIISVEHSLIEENERTDIQLPLFS